MQGGPVDELLDVAVECPALDQLQVEVGRTPEDRGIAFGRSQVKGAEANRLSPNASERYLVTC
jgi:hypothetical protein